MKSSRLTALALAASSAFSAHASVTETAIDNLSGLQWAYTDFASEGASQGDRAATATDFIGLLSNVGLSVDASKGQAGVPLGGVFGATFDGEGQALASNLPQWAGPGTALGFRDTKLLRMDGVTNLVDVSFGWLNGEAGLMGAIGHDDTDHRLLCNAPACQDRKVSLATYLGG